jgi:N-acetylglucosaminyldiphosphoundecaprenol N-acetyl-beta-D-mannosaminyltransferase
MDRRRVLDTEFTVASPARLHQEILARIASGHGGVVVHCNLHSLYTMRCSPAMKMAIQSSALVIFEGIGLKMAARSLSGTAWPDVSGTDLVPALLESADARHLRIAFVGARPGIAARAAARMRGAWTLALAADGFADLEDEERFLQQLETTGPDLILLGLGSPLQEITAHRWSKRLSGMTIWCVGGLFDFMSGNVQRAPVSWRRRRLEWLWRFLMEPARLGRRYACEGPWLIARTITAFFSMPRGPGIPALKEVSHDRER